LEDSQIGAYDHFGLFGGVGNVPVDTTDRPMVTTINL
jgi:hypothetical protein